LEVREIMSTPAITVDTDTSVVKTARALSAHHPPGTSSRRPTRAIVYLERIAANVRAICDLVGPDVRVLAVVKANGYGHGAIPVARVALAAGASWLSVACVDEGLALRDAGISAPILVMGYTAPEEMAVAVRAGLTLTVGTAVQFGALAGVARDLRHEVRIHVKVDSGMSRYGFFPEQLEDLGRLLRATPEILMEGCFTHFARAEEHPGLATDRQFQRFSEAVDVLARQGIRPEILHAANSGATLIAPHTHLNMVRAGIVLYGYRPDRALAPEVRLQPAMEIRSCLARVETLPRGARVGYGHTHELQRAGKVGLVPVGYADGLQRSLSGSGYLVAGGVRVPIIGRVSMDQCSVDLSEAGPVVEGDPVAVIGAQGGASVWADDLGDWGHTIAYEILCGISQRVPRTYFGGATI
jgi:alanine racemase